MIEKSFRNVTTRGTNGRVEKLFIFNERSRNCTFAETRRFQIKFNHRLNYFAIIGRQEFVSKNPRKYPRVSLRGDAFCQLAFLKNSLAIIHSCSFALHDIQNLIVLCALCAHALPAISAGTKKKEELVKAKRCMHPARIKHEGLRTINSELRGIEVIRMHINSYSKRTCIWRYVSKFRSPRRSVRSKSANLPTVSGALHLHFRGYTIYFYGDSSLGSPFQYIIYTSPRRRVRARLRSIKSHSPSRFPRRVGGGGGRGGEEKGSSSPCFPADWI